VGMMEGLFCRSKPSALMPCETFSRKRHNSATRRKDPEDWTTGGRAMTGPQRSYLQTFCREASEEFDPSLTKAEASKKIEELQAKTHRGKM
jgi:Protein of unknown function (DUF3072)